MIPAGSLDHKSDSRSMWTQKTITEIGSMGQGLCRRTEVLCLRLDRKMDRSRTGAPSCSRFLGKLV